MYLIIIHIKHMMGVMVVGFVDNDCRVLLLSSVWFCTLQLSEAILTVLTCQ